MAELSIHCMPFAPARLKRNNYSAETCELMGGATEEVEHLMSSASTKSLLDLTQLHDAIIIIAMSPIYKFSVILDCITLNCITLNCIELRCALKSTCS